MTDSILTKDTKAKIKRLAYYQIIGGFVGTLLSIYSIIKSESPASYIYFLATTLMVFNLFTIFSGQQLITGKVKRGLLLSLICQIPQIINFTIAGFGFPALVLDSYPALFFSWDFIPNLCRSKHQ